MTEFQLERLLSRVVKDIDELPLSAVQLVGGLFSMHEGVPKWLVSFIMVHLGKRTDMSVVSPAAEAVMRLVAFAKYADTAFAQMEIQRQHALLRAIALDDKVLVAAAFLHRLAAHIDEAKTQDRNDSGKAVAFATGGPSHWKTDSLTARTSSAYF